MGDRRDSGVGAAAAAGASNPLILQSRAGQDQPPQRFPAFDVPQPKDLTTADRELVERSRFLSETYKYSGYYVVPDPSRTQLLQQHRLVSSSFAPDGSAAQQIYTHTFERYSDRYRKILGKKTFHSEIESPNTHLFPAELLSDKNGRAIRAAGNTTFTSKVQFLSTKTLLSEVTRLVTARAPVVDTSGDKDMDDRGDDHVAGAKREGGEEGEEEEEDENQEMDEEEEDDLDGGDDYLENHGDDDEDGGDAFGDDGDEGETF